MKSFRPLRWAIAMILALVCAAGAQNTAPVPTTFKIFEKKNIVGEPLVSAAMVADPDTMPNIVLRAVVADTTDSTHVDLNVTITYGPLIASKNFTDVRTDAELWLPDTTWNAGIPDSLFSIVMLDTRPLVPGEEFRLEVKATEFLINTEGNLKVIMKRLPLFKNWN